MQQTHSANFTWVSSPSDKKIPDVDATLTTNPNLALTVRTADCLPILLYHPSGILGVLHAGRKGTQQRILAKVLTHLKEEKNILTDLQLWFGPAICEACYQIDRETNTHYNLIAENMAQAYSVFAAEDLLITIDSSCTQCLSEEYHSYRVGQAAVQMNYAAISLLK